MLASCAGQVKLTSNYYKIDFDTFKKYLKIHSINVKEVKLIFETLNEGMVSNATRTPIKESLGSASKPAGVAKKAPIMEIDPQVARWQKLAGLK